MVVYVVQMDNSLSLKMEIPDQGAFVFTVNTGAVATPTPVATTNSLNDSVNHYH